MFAPCHSQPPYFTSTPKLRILTDEEFLHTSRSLPSQRSPPPYRLDIDNETNRTKKAKQQKASNNTARPSTVNRKTYRKAFPLVAVCEFANELLAYLNDAAFLYHLSNRINVLAASESQSSSSSSASLLSLYQKLLPVNKFQVEPTTHLTKLPRLRFSSILRYLSYGLLAMSVGDIVDKEEIDMLYNVTSRVNGIFVIKVNGRMVEADNDSAHPSNGRFLSQEHQISLKAANKTSANNEADEEHIYRAQQLTRCLSICLDHNMKSLYHIDLHGLQLFNWSPFFAALPSLSYLRHLYIRQCHLSDTLAMEAMGSISRINSLSHLSLAANGLTDGVCAAICRLIIIAAQKRQVLEWTDTLRHPDKERPSQGEGPSQRRSSNSSISSSSLASILSSYDMKKESIREQGLTSLDVSQNAFSDIGVKQIIDCLAEDNWMRAIYLHYNQHTINSISSFMAMLSKNTSLLIYSLLPATATILTFPSSPSSSSVSTNLSSTAALPSSPRAAIAMRSMHEPYANARKEQQQLLSLQHQSLLPSVIIQDQTLQHRYGVGVTSHKKAETEAKAGFQSKHPDFIVIRESYLAVSNLCDDIAAVPTRTQKATKVQKPPAQKKADQKTSQDQCKVKRDKQDAKGNKTNNKTKQGKTSQHEPLVKRKEKFHPPNKEIVSQTDLVEQGADE